MFEKENITERRTPQQATEKFTENLKMFGAEVVVGVPLTVMMYLINTAVLNALHMDFGNPEFQTVALLGVGAGSTSRLRKDIVRRLFKKNYEQNSNNNH